MMKWMNSMMRKSKVICYDMGYTICDYYGQEEKVNKMSNQELNSIIVGQTIVLVLMFVDVVFLMTNN